MKTEQTSKKFIEDSMIESVRKAIRLEIERENHKRNVEATYALLAQLLQDCKIEIIPNKGKKNVLRSNEDKDEK